MYVCDNKWMRQVVFGILMVQSNVDYLIYNEKRNDVVFVNYLE